MKHIVLKAVSMPATLFWVPYKTALLNMSFFAVAFVIGTVLCKINPVFPFAILLAGHGFLITLAMREPHLDGLIEAWFSARIRTVNLIKVKGNKFIC